MLCQPSPPKAHAQALVRWKLLRDHDTAEVIATIDDAFADNASLSACIDAGTTHNGNCVTLVVRYPGPGIAQGIVQAGTNTRPRSENEIMDLYRRAVASGSSLPSSMRSTPGFGAVAHGEGAAWWVALSAWQIRRADMPWPPRATSGEERATCPHRRTP
jgi:hypothetical protein